MNCRTAVIGAIGIIALAPATPAAAHHSIWTTVNTDVEVVQSMTLTRIDWINPHIWLHFRLAKPDGSVVRDVAVEAESLAGMRQRGIPGPEAFPTGRVYKVTYYGNRDGSPGGNLIAMEEEDGPAGAEPRSTASPLPPLPALRPLVPAK
jgi:hypothetical protein